jgi:hypothetical protein
VMMSRWMMVKYLLSNKRKCIFAFLKKNWNSYEEFVHK